MKTVKFSRIVDEVKELCIEANYVLDDSVVKSFELALEKETSPLAQEILKQLIENARVACDEQYPICQDTGTAVFLVELGQEVEIVGGSVLDAIRQGVSSGYREGYLRGSMVGDPLQRKNTGDNTPPMVTVQLVPGDNLRIMCLAKGGGCENMSAFKMLTPAEGVEGVKRFVVETVRDAGGNPCPPIVVGVGIGGTFEQCAFLSKKALFRNLGERHPDPFYAKLEEELLERINKLGIGPMGLGGRTTALDVHIETLPCHIASLPVAVNMDCHAHRMKGVTL